MIGTIPWKKKHLDSVRNRGLWREGSLMRGTRVPSEVWDIEEKKWKVYHLLAQV
jgi:hypothetical protein